MMKKQTQQLFSTLILVSVVYVLVVKPLHEWSHHGHHHELEAQNPSNNTSTNSTFSEKCSICDFRLIPSDNQQPTFFAIGLFLCQIIEFKSIESCCFINQTQTIQLRAPPAC